MAVPAAGVDEAQPVPVDVNTLPAVPGEVKPVPPEAAGKALVKVTFKSVPIDSAVEPLDCNAKTPEVSAVVLTPEEPDTTPLSEFMVEANLLLLVLAIFKMPAGHCL